MVERRDKRRLAAILAADMVGYSRLMAADERGTLARLNNYRQEVIDPAIARHDGRIIKTTGDGMLGEFASVVDAVECAVEVQKLLSRRNAELVPEHRPEFRIGINLGDVIVQGALFSRRRFRSSVFFVLCRASRLEADRT